MSCQNPTFGHFLAEQLKVFLGNLKEFWRFLLATVSVHDGRLCGISFILALTVNELGAGNFLRFDFGLWFFEIRHNLLIMRVVVKGISKVLLCYFLRRIKSRER